MSDNPQDDPMSSPPTSSFTEHHDDDDQVPTSSPAGPQIRQGEVDQYIASTSDLSPLATSCSSEPQDRHPSCMRQWFKQKIYNEYRQANSAPDDPQNHQLLRLEVDYLYAHMRNLLDEPVVEEQEYDPSTPPVVQETDCCKKMKFLKSNIDQMGKLLPRLMGCYDALEMLKKEKEMESKSNLEKVNKANEELKEAHLEAIRAKEERKELKVKLRNSTTMLARKQEKLSEQMEIVEGISKALSESDTLLRQAISNTLFLQRPRDVRDKVRVLVLDYNRMSEELNRTKLELKQEKKGMSEEINMAKLELEQANVGYEELLLKLKESKEEATRLSRREEVTKRIRKAMSIIGFSQKPVTDQVDMLIDEYLAIKDAVSCVKLPREVISKDLPSKVRRLVLDYKRTCESLSDSKLKLEHALDGIDDTAFPKEGKEPIDKVKGLVDFFRKKNNDIRASLWDPKLTQELLSEILDDAIPHIAIEIDQILKRSNEKVVTSLSKSISFVASLSDTIGTAEPSTSATVTHESSTKDGELYALHGDGQFAPAVSQDETMDNEKAAPVVSQDVPWPL